MSGRRWVVWVVWVVGRSFVPGHGGEAVEAREWEDGGFMPDRAKLVRLRRAVAG